MAAPPPSYPNAPPPYTSPEEEARQQEMAKQNPPPVEIPMPPGQPHYTQQPGMPPVAPAVPPTVIVASFGPDPMNVLCPHCHVQGVTETEYKSGTLTWICCLLFGILVFCCDSLKDVEHRCSNCKRVLGTYVASL